MSYEIAPMILYSQDRTRMLKFLSDVFEFEVEVMNEQNYLVFAGGLSFQVLNASESNLDLSSNSNSLILNFRLKSKEEFDEIVNKYNFFKYRRYSESHLETHSLSLDEEMLFFEDNDSKTIIIRDIDHRPWRFELKKVAA